MFNVCVTLPKLMKDRPYWSDVYKWAVEHDIHITVDNGTLWFTCEEHAILFRLTFNV